MQQHRDTVFAKTGFLSLNIAPMSLLLTVFDSWSYFLSILPRRTNVLYRQRLSLIDPSSHPQQVCVYGECGGGGGGLGMALALGERNGRGGSSSIEVRKFFFLTLARHRV